MARLELVPFSDEHLEDAARLLAARHARDRRAEPLLPARFENAPAARVELEHVWRAEGASGAAALREGRLTGYLIAAPRDDRVWGENVWVDVPGHAVEEAEDVRDLYAWFRLGFGQQQAHGVREVQARTAVRPPRGIEIRRPSEDEIEALLEVDLALPRHQQTSPVFSARPLPSREELRAEWRETLTGDDEDVLVGYRDGRPLACWSVVAAELSRHFRGLTLPEGGCYIAFASTVPEARGSGIGVALTDASLQRAAENGYEVVVTDWRVTNLLASRFWPKRGFRTFLLRLYRSIP
jgi:ribosomal protein S18 acetylase RimI-like enzyme